MATDELVPARPTPRRDNRRSQGRTSLLGVVAVVLAGLLAVEGWYLLARPSPQPSAARPIVLGQIAWQSVADTGRQSVSLILNTDYHFYDAHTAAATERMTPEFARTYRTNATDLRAGFQADRKEVSTTIVGVGVVSASTSQVRLVMLLNQTITTKRGSQPWATKALVTMEHTDRGWLVADIDVGEL
jgi:hypothetical protein